MGDIMANHLTIKIRTTQWDYFKKHLQDRIVRYCTQIRPTAYVGCINIKFDTVNNLLIVDVTSKNRITVSSSFIEYVSTVCGNPYDDYPKIVTVHSNNKLAVLNVRYFTMHSLVTEDTITYMYIYDKPRTLHKQCELTPDDCNNLISNKINTWFDEQLARYKYALAQRILEG